MSDSEKRIDDFTYFSYLQVEKITDAQEPVSDLHGRPAHVEMLYIVVHQVYELWFKEILHELGAVIRDFDQDFINERNIGVAVTRLRRVSEIQNLLLQQISVIETMTPLDFLDFRKYLGTASGFQSYQWRMIENRLGIKESDRIAYGNKAYSEEFSGEILAKIKASEEDPSLIEVVGRWLERTPFLSFEGFDFIEQYERAVAGMHQRERELIQNQKLPKEETDRLLEMIEKGEESYKQLLDKEEHERLVKRGMKRLSHQATLAALFINLYRDEPILHLPFQLIETLIEIDENFARWRSRHAIMVHRMLGRKMGTGHSSGYDYLKRTVEKYRVFTDFYDLSTFLIPRSDIPKLPDTLERGLGFYYSAGSDG